MGRKNGCMPQQNQRMGLTSRRKEGSAVSRLVGRISLPTTSSSSFCQHLQGVVQQGGNTWIHSPFFLQVRRTVVVRCDAVHQTNRRPCRGNVRLGKDDQITIRWPTIQFPLVSWGPYSPLVKTWSMCGWFVDSYTTYTYLYVIIILNSTQ